MKQVHFKYACITKRFKEAELNNTSRLFSGSSSSKKRAAIVICTSGGGWGIWISSLAASRRLGTYFRKLFKRISCFLILKSLRISNNNAPLYLYLCTFWRTSFVTRKFRRWTASRISRMKEYINTSKTLMIPFSVACKARQKFWDHVSTAFDFWRYAIYWRKLEVITLRLFSLAGSCL